MQKYVNNYKFHIPQNRHAFSQTEETVVLDETQLMNMTVSPDIGVQAVNNAHDAIRIEEENKIFSEVNMHDGIMPVMTTNEIVISF